MSEQTRQYGEERACPAKAGLLSEVRQSGSLDRGAWAKKTWREQPRESHARGWGKKPN